MGVGGARMQPPTSVPSAKPGVQYLPVDETITFPPGVTSERVTIPIVAGAANPGMLSFEVIATQVGVAGSQPVGPEATEDVFLAQNINAPVPRIDGGHMVLSGGRVSGFVLHFSLPMDPASVQNVKAYSLKDDTVHWHPAGLFGPLGGGSDSTAAVRLKTATYDPSTNTVDLHLAHPCPAETLSGLSKSQRKFHRKRSQVARRGGHADQRGRQRPGRRFQHHPDQQEGDDL